MPNLKVICPKCKQEVKNRNDWVCWDCIKNGRLSGGK